MHALSTEETGPPRTGMMRFRKATTKRLAPDLAKRQGEIAHMAFLALGRDAALAFLNTEHAGLGGRPLDVATESDAGRDNVEAEIGRIADAAPSGA